MALPVSLREFIDAMKEQSEMIANYIHLKTGDLEFINELDEDLVMGLESGFHTDLDENDKACIEVVKKVKSDEDFISLPSQFEINDYRIMEDFIESLNDESKQEELYRAIRGRGAFRRFKDRIIDLEVREAWFAFEDKAYKKKAIEFLESHDIPYKDDTQ